MFNSMLAAFRRPCRRRAESLCARRASGSWLRSLVLFGVSLSVATTAVAEAPSAVFQASEQLSLAALERVVERGSPEVAAAAGELSVARAEARQARLLGNPTLDAAWGTIPLGRTNPIGLERPLANVPNYEVGLGYTIPVAKRGKRMRRADAVVRGHDAELAHTRRDRALLLADVLGRLAVANLRRDGIEALVAQSKRAVQLAEARLSSKFGTPLDVDQLQIEVERTRQGLLGVDAEVSEALADCAGIVGAPCEGFVDAASARGFLARWLTPHSGKPVERADLRALGAYADAAHADIDLARAERLPDPTVRLGYTHDRFLISGNQRNSVSVGLSVPLPLVDHGQIRERAARASYDALREERSRRVAVAAARAPALQSQLERARDRCTQLGQDAVPRAQAVLADLERAAERGLLPLTQVIQSRRVLSELFIEEAESCGDAFAAAVALNRETWREGDVP